MHARGIGRLICGGVMAQAESWALSTSGTVIMHEFLSLPGGVVERHLHMSS